MLNDVEENDELFFGFLFYFVPVTALILIDIAE
jgi:hypothetical protein